MNRPPLHITLINQFHAPEIAATAAYSHAMAAALVRRGHRVTVLASSGGYSGGKRGHGTECIDGVRIVRLPGDGSGRSTPVRRVYGYVLFLVHCLRRLALSARPDLIVAMTTPPYLGLIARWAARFRGARHAHWVMDCYPDVLAAAWQRADGGMPFAARLMVRLLGVLSRRHWSVRSSTVVTLGPAIAERVRRHRGADVPWVPLWSDDSLLPWTASPFPPLRQSRDWQGEDLVLCYSGNLGRGHLWREFAEAAARLGSSGPLWAFAGSGNRRGEFARWHATHPGARVAFLPYAPHAQLREHLCAADVHLASMQPGWEGCIVPSKVQSAFAVGRPVIAVAPAASETAMWVRDSGGGWVVAPGDVDGLLAAVAEARDPGERARRGAAARRYAERHFASARNLAALVSLFEAPQPVRTRKPAPRGNGRAVPALPPLAPPREAPARPARPSLPPFLTPSHVGSP